jgi:protein-L-isoaspartate(D-aspartate) O-methyltransferase
MTTNESRRQFFAEEIAALANLETPGLVDALTAIPRERFLRPGPWLVRSETDLFGGPRPTPDADPSHAYHNYAIAIDPARQLFTGVPSLLTSLIDKLGLRKGARVLHVGAGLGYYTALLAHVIGETGRVLAFEIDPLLAADATLNLEVMPWVEVRCADGVSLSGETFDAILVNAGVTHAQDAWLDRLAPAGRLILPLTATMPAMGTIGKGFMMLLTPRVDGDFDVRLLTPVAIYSAIGLRDEQLNAELGKALMRNPFPRITRLRRDRHEAAQECWLHGAGGCLSPSLSPSQH